MGLFGIFNRKANAYRKELIASYAEHSDLQSRYIDLLKKHGELQDRHLEWGEQYLALLQKGVEDNGQ